MTREYEDIFSYDDGDELAVSGYRYNDGTGHVRFLIETGGDYVIVPLDQAIELANGVLRWVMNLPDGATLEITNETTEVTEPETKINPRLQALKDGADVLGRPGGGFMSGPGIAPVSDLLRLAVWLSEGAVLDNNLRKQ